MKTYNVDFMLEGQLTSLKVLADDVNHTDTYTVFYIQNANPAPGTPAYHTTAVFTNVVAIREELTEELIAKYDASKILNVEAAKDAETEAS